MFSGSITVLIVLVAFFSPGCAKITFIAKQAWKASYGVNSSVQYKKLADTVSKALRSVFNNSKKYYDVKIPDVGFVHNEGQLRGVFNNSKMFYDVKVTEITFTEKAGQVQVMAKLCLVVKADDVYIEDVFTAKVKSGKLDETFLVKVDSAKFEAVGVTVRDWKAKEGECTKCNKGGAGEFVIERTCTLVENGCKGLKNKTSKNCVEYCSAASITVNSFLILTLGVLLSFSFQ
ncbi:hypothetical protein OS493_009990 [Desmophyllum pertusum]|uniref:Uncharacterized protein n=1 Tax=Desmophyllum pertusum TaxID=174260 RepID=A0A9W9YEA5_9CNID|nr:hypothetical protein OS493_009990 [Desmophyllum pertusum]